MTRKNDYTPQNHPVESNMNLGTQTAKLYGKLNIAVKKDPDFIILDGNADIDDELFYDGNS